MGWHGVALPNIVPFLFPAPLVAILPSLGAEGRGRAPPELSAIPAPSTESFSAGGAGLEGCE